MALLHKSVRLCIVFNAPQQSVSAIAYELLAHFKFEVWSPSMLRAYTMVL